MQVLTKDILNKLYIKDKISTTIIGEKYGCHSATVFRKLKKYNIPIWGKGTFLKDVKFSEEHKHNISEAKKGKPTANQFKLGHPPTKGTKGMIGIWHRTDEEKERISESKKGIKRKPFSKEWRKNISIAGKGKRALEKHWNWKGGISVLNIRIRQTSEYKEWRLMVFGRDNFTCQDCGKRGTYLQAHHIKSFSSIIQYHEITTIEEALECEELFDINNGITLCKEYHEGITKNNLKRNKNGKFI